MTAPAAGTPAINGQTGMMDVTTGQFKYFGTPEYDAWKSKITPELNAIGITPTEYQGGGVAARLMGNPLTSAYSTEFANNNTTPGGGQAFAQRVGGIIGYGKQNGFVDANGMSTGQGEVTGLTPAFSSYAQGGSENYASGNQPGQIDKTPPSGVIGGTTPGVSNPVATSNSTSLSTSSVGVPAYSSFDPSTDTTRGQVDSMLQQDSEYLQNARTKAAQNMNARGLLNSSIANEAGVKAGIDAAALIGDATANQYQKSKLTTQELNNRMDLANLDSNTRLRIADITNGMDQKKLDSSNSQSVLNNYRMIAADTNNAINAILVSPTLTPEAKQQAINEALMRHDEYVQFQDGIMGYNLSSLISYQ